MIYLYSKIHKTIEKLHAAGIMTSIQKIQRALDFHHGIQVSPNKNYLVNWDNFIHKYLMYLTPLAYKPLSDLGEKIEDKKFVRYVGAKSPKL